MIYNEKECQKAMRLKSKTRYTIWFILLLAFMVSVATITILSVHADDSGSCGDNLTYTYTESNHTLTISGTGEMDDYSNSLQPWFLYRTKIEQIIIENGVTSIGSRAFSGCKKLYNISISNSVTKIGDGVLSNCFSLTSLIIPNSVTSMGSWSFMDYYMLESIVLPNCITSIPNYAFRNCRIKSIVIPNSVTSIGKGAFKDCNYLISVVVSNNITIIDEWAFRQCNSLTSIVIPDNVTSIGSYAFSGCSSLISITIPENVTSIGDYAFSTCSSLERVEISDNVETIGSSAFNGCGNLSSFTIPDGITMIGSRTFANCSRLRSITIPESVTSIGDYAFVNCIGLTSVTIPKSVTTIGSNAFNGCKGLTYITIPESATTIGISSFDGCNISVITNLSDLDFIFKSNSFGGIASKAKIIIDRYGNKSFIDDAEKDYIITDEGFLIDATNDKYVMLAYFGDEDCVLLPNNILGHEYIINLFYGVTNVIIPEWITSIDNNAFSGCGSLKSITIPDSVTSIGSGAFMNCSGLSNIVISENVTSIGTNAFYGCSSLESVTILGGVTTVANYSFRDCVNLSSITLPESVTSIGAGAFWKCNNLTSIILPENVTSIGTFAFLNCWSLTSINIPEGVTSIGSGMFSGCSSLTSITIPDSVTSIGSSAFNGCRSLTSIILPENVTSIGTFAFLNCWSLTSINIPEGVTSIGSSAFNGCQSLTSIDIPEGITSIGENAFSGCCSLTNIEIPNNITSIGNLNFDGCISLESIIIPNNIPQMSGISFKNCFSLESITIPHCVTNIQDNAFSCCFCLSNITLPDCLTSIGEEAFSNCISLTSIDIPSSVESIGNYAFSGCCSLTNIIIPENVSEIGNGAFCDCCNIMELFVKDENTIYYSDGNCIIETESGTIIAGCSNSSLLNVESINIIGNDAFSGCDYLSSISIPDSVTRIGNNAFYGCSSLTSIIIPESVTSIGAWAFIGSPLESVYVLSTMPPQLESDYNFNSSECTFYVHGNEYANGWSNIWDFFNQDNFPYTIIEMYSVDNAEGIKTSSPIISHNGKDYYESGTEVTLSHGDYSGYIFEGYSVNGTPIEGNTFTMPDEDVTVEAILTKLEPVFYRHALVLSGEIGVKFRISFPEGFDSTGCYTDFTASDGRHSIVTFDNAETINDSTDRYFTFFINALELAEDITATLHYGNDETIEDHYSAMTYIQYVSENMSTNETLVELVKALHTYGYYLQNSGWTDDKVSHVAIPVPAVLLTSTDIETAINGVSEKTVTKDLGDSGISNVKLSIKLNEMTVIKVLVKPADDSVIITTSGYTQVEIGNETYYQFETEGIGAKNLGNNYTITIETNKGTATVTASVMSYVKIALNSGGLSEAKQLTLAAFYQYHIAANNY